MATPRTVAVFLALLAAATQAAAYSLQLDLGAPQGSSPLLRPSVFAGYADDRARTRLEDFSRLGYIRIEAESAVANATGMDDYLARLSLNDAAIEQLQASGAEVLVQVSKMPLWLSANPSAEATCNGWKVYQASPAADWKAYEDFIYQTVDYYNNQRGFDLVYDTWAEPDSECQWLGTRDELLALLRHFVIGAKRADPAARVVLPSVSNWKASIGDSNGDNWLLKDPRQSLIHALIQDFAATPVPELGWSRIPIDFISFHSFSPQLSRIRSGLAQVRQWLDDAGYTGSGIMVTEWNAHMAEALPNASYFLHATRMLEDAAVDAATFASLQDFYSLEHTVRGDYGMLARDYALRKPAYHAMDMLDRLPEGRIAAATDSPTVETMAAWDGQTLGILLWNYVDREALLEDYFMEQGYDDLFLTGPEPTVPGPEHVAAWLDLLDYSRLLAGLETTPQDILLPLGQLGFGSYRLQHWVIDDTHSNLLYSYQQAAESGGTLDEILASLQGQDVLEQVEDLTVEPASDRTVSMSPHAIHLFRITPLP